jgi:hypothetical protein
MKIAYFIISIFLILSISISGLNIVLSNEIENKTFINQNNPPKIVRPLTYYDKYNDILYVAAMDPDNDKICVGIDWDKDQKIDEWSNYRKIKTRWEINCNDRTGNVYIIAKDEHGAISEWYDTIHKIKSINNYSNLLFNIGNLHLIKSYFYKYLE